jgi:PhnB protein
MQQQVRPIPEGFHSLTPHLVCEGAAAAMDFYVKAFGAVDLGRMPGPGGKIMHGTMRIGDSVLMLVDDFPDFGSHGPLALKGSPVTIHLYVEDADASFARAVEAGAKAVMPLADMFWGDRYGMLEDPFGHKWAIATHKRDMTPEQIGEAMQKAMQQSQGCGDQPGAQQ